jgi:apolipoprotein N-acyltransferase
MGFPWFFLGYSQHVHLPLIQIASWGGIYSVSFLIIMINRALYELIFYSGSDRNILFRKLFIFVFSIGMITAVYIYGHFRLEKSSKKENDSIPHFKVALIQGNIAQEEKWNPIQARFILKKYENLTLNASTAKPDLIVWPETSLPSDLKMDKYLRTRIENLARRVNSYFLLGGNDDRLDSEGIVTNAAFLVSPQGKIIDQYDKVHLVPYGEYVPLRSWTPWVGKFTIGEIDFSPGKIFKVFRIGDVAFSSVICFEDILPFHVRKFVKAGARLMINVTNDAWFGKSQAAEEHLHLSRFSALANGVGLARATNTGISAFISPYGEILESVQDKNGNRVEVEGFAVRELFMESIETFYRKWGDVFSLACGVIVFIFLGLEILSLMRKTHNSLIKGG